MIMEKGQIETSEARKWKDALLKEIFDAYKESGALYKKTTNLETRQAILDMKRGFDLAIQHLSPSNAGAEKIWEELRAQFAS
ncbi:MAG TPA: hypothetical protein VMD27_10425 [Candidatus Aquilonibacter sp.]|nr:hypothetical protein [Candidatus Aquilonibacter sp.]